MLCNKKNYIIRWVQLTQRNYFFISKAPCDMQRGNPPTTNVACKQSAKIIIAAHRDSGNGLKVHRNYVSSIPKRCRLESVLKWCPAQNSSDILTGNLKPRAYHVWCVFHHCLHRPISAQYEKREWTSPIYLPCFDLHVFFFCPAGGRTSYDTGNAAGPFP